ncbi:MAG: TetR/AcrR family transcriptional regulator C-terminal ligand-binding domain-containing protein [Silvibacterium sp.]|nr:TetR/AcrR family transcriptional regulator C-terminal ligand-binding domain-containing protein [Silvibacterium sp.]
MKKRRPGGRTARNQAAVFEAAAALLAEKEPDSLTMTEIAERAGVAATSLYRRWGEVGILLLEVAVDQLNREHPLPDTGSLDGDLRAWAQKIAGGLRSRRGSALFKVIIASSARGGVRDSGRVRAMEPRTKQIEAMLNRARERGEQVPPVSAVLDHLLAPLYFRALFGAPGDGAFAAGLVDHLLRSDRE